MCLRHWNGSPEPIIRHTDFSTGFYAANQVMADNQQNMVVSPASVLILLSVLLGSTGPQGNTENEICKALNGKDDPCTPELRTRLVNAARTIANQLQTPVDGSTGKKSIIRIANAAFVKEAYDINPNFIFQFSDKNRNAVHSINFESPTAISTINDWANSSTDGLISEIYKSSDEISKDVVMILLNAISFKGKWKKRFSPFTTTREAFQLGGQSGKTKEVDMMRISENLRYFKNEQSGFHLVFKKFEFNRFLFAILLPLGEKDIQVLDRAFMEGIPWAQIYRNSKEMMIDLKLPKFKVEGEIELKSTLQRLGVRDLFDQEKANLSGISTKDNLFVNNAKQNAVIEVNEHGVRAAAVTSMQISLTSILIPEKEFFVDRPFFCAIYDTQLDLPLFIARVTEPESL